MRWRVVFPLIYLVVSLTLPACRDSSPPATPDLVATEVAVQKAAVATLTAEAPPLATLTSTSTPGGQATSDSLPTNTPTATSVAIEAQASPTNSSATSSQCSVVSNQLNLRPGPGTVYEPVISVLTAGALLNPLAFSPTGSPEGQWLQVQVLATGQVGWVGAAPQFVSCNVDMAQKSASPEPKAPL